MRITLNESEIKQALVRYVAGQGVDVAGRDVAVSMTAGRGANGYTADIDITEKNIKHIADCAMDSNPGINLEPQQETYEEKETVGASTGSLFKQANE